MAISFPQSMVVLSGSWTAFIASATSKALTARIQYDDDGTVYTIFAFDLPIVYSCTIWKGLLPPSVVAGGYSQAQNDADRASFEATDKPTANAVLTPKISSGSSIQTLGATRTQLVTYSVEVALAGGGGKDMISIFNPIGSGKIVKLRKAWAVVPASLGQKVIVPFEVRHATAITTGAITAAKPLDPADAAAASVVREAPLGITDAAAPLWWTWLQQTNTAQGSTDAMVQQIHDGLAISELKPITLRPGNGCYLREIENNTSTFRMGFLFTEESS